MLGKILASRRGPERKRGFNDQLSIERLLNENIKIDVRSLRRRSYSGHVYLDTGDFSRASTSATEIAESAVLGALDPDDRAVTRQFPSSSTHVFQKSARPKTRHSADVTFFLHNRRFETFRYATTSSKLLKFIIHPARIKIVGGSFLIANDDA